MRSNKLRQMGTSLEMIREDHRLRYEWAANLAESHALHSALDLGCGIGYGAHMLADSGLEVNAIERDEPTYHEAVAHYSRPGVTFHLGDATTTDLSAELVTAFEFLEHTDSAEAVLRRMAFTCRYLAASVPNEEVVPFRPGRANPEHVRHYTPDEFRALLVDCGWTPLLRAVQTAKKGPGASPSMLVDTGRTIVAWAESARTA